MIIGFDLDGVLANADSTLYRFIYYGLKDTNRELYDLLRATYFLELRPLNNPELFLTDGDTYYIIPGRHNKTDDEATKKWCSKHCPSCKGVYLVGGENISTREAKRDKISELDIDVYFDDDPHVVSYLRENLPEVTIIQLGGVTDKKYLK